VSAASWLSWPPICSRSNGSKEIKNRYRERQNKFKEDNIDLEWLWETSISATMPSKICLLKTFLLTAERLRVIAAAGLGMSLLGFSIASMHLIVSSLPLPAVLRATAAAAASPKGTQISLSGDRQPFFGTIRFVTIRFGLNLIFLFRGLLVPLRSLLACHRIDGRSGRRQASELPGATFCRSAEA